MTSKGSLPQEVEVFNLLLHSFRFYRKIFVVDFFENVSWPHDPILGPVMMILWMCVVIYRTTGRLRPASVPQIGVLLQHIISYGTHQPANCPFALMMILIMIMMMTLA